MSDFFGIVRRLRAERNYWRDRALALEQIRDLEHERDRKDQMAWAKEQMAVLEELNARR